MDDGQDGAGRPAVPWHPRLREGHLGEPPPGFHGHGPPGQLPQLRRHRTLRRVRGGLIRPGHVQAHRRRHRRARAGRGVGAQASDWLHLGGAQGLQDGRRSPQGRGPSGRSRCDHAHRRQGRAGRRGLGPGLAARGADEVAHPSAHERRQAPARGPARGLPGEVRRASPSRRRPGRVRCCAEPPARPEQGRGARAHRGCPRQRHAVDEAAVRVARAQGGRGPAADDGGLRVHHQGAGEWHAVVHGLAGLEGCQ